MHSQCGGRPGFCAKFLLELTSGASAGATGGGAAGRQGLLSNEELEPLGDICVVHELGGRVLPHLDKLSAENLRVVACKSKGNSSMQLEEHIIRGCHPLSEGDTKMNAVGQLRINMALF